MGRRRVVGGLAVPGRVAVAMVLAGLAFPVVRVPRWDRNMDMGMLRGLMAATRLMLVVAVTAVLSVRCLRALRA